MGGSDAAGCILQGMAGKHGEIIRPLDIQKPELSTLP
jgi:hypothetical protein